MPIADVKSRQTLTGRPVSSTEVDIPRSGQSHMQLTVIVKITPNFSRAEEEQFESRKKQDCREAAFAVSLFVAQKRSIDEDGA